MRGNEIEQLENDGGDTAEVTWTANALERLSHGGRLDGGGEARGIDVIGGRYEDKIAAVGGESLQVGFQRTWILAEVFFGSKLTWVNEDRGDNDVGLLTGDSNETEMTLVQRAHR